MLPENVTPLAPAPEAPVTSTEDGVILIDTRTPLGDLPQTGMTPAALSVAAAALMALSALAACAGIFFKKRQNG
ncbi:MAG: LPXTG cell wall anchor domain-containing protein [Oscillospiraceae bacterium]